jgi:hypothetical protein
MTTTETQSASAKIMHQCPSSGSEKKMMDFLADLNQQKRLMQSCADALRACTLCSMKATEEGLNCLMVLYLSLLLEQYQKTDARLCGGCVT